MPEKITIVKDGGEQVNSNIVSVFLIPDMNKKYIITTENAVDPHGLTVLHVSEIQGDTLVKVATDEEWATIKTIMRAIISGSVGNYQYIPSFETINAAGAYSRDISVSAPASKQMIDGYANGEKVEPVGEDSANESTDSANADSIFPTAPVDTEENEVVPGIAMDDPVTIENTPEQPKVDPSVQGAMPLDPATLPVQEPVPQAPAPVPAAPAVPTPIIQDAVPTPVIQEAPANAPTPVVEAPVAPVATPVPEQPAAPAPASVPGAELVPEANPAVNPTTVVPEVMEQPVPTPDSIVQDVSVVEPAPEAVLDKVDEVTAAVNNVTNEATTPNGAAVAVPADPNAVEVNAPVEQNSVAPEIDALTAASTIVDVNPAVEAAPQQVVQDTTAQTTESVVDVLTPVPDDAVVTTPAPIIDVNDAPVAEIPVAEEAPQAETLAEEPPTIPEVVPEAPQEAVPAPESVPQEVPAEQAPAPAEAPAEATVENAVPEIPVIGNVTPVQNIPQAPQQSVVVNQSTAMPQTSAMKNLGITLDFGSQPSLDSNATLDEIVAGAQELFLEGTKNLVLVMTEKLYKDLREKEEELKKREVVLAQRERAINDSTLAMMNGDMMNQPMMGGMMGQPMMGQPMMGGMMGQPMMGQPMMGQPMMQQPVGTQVPPQTDQANGQV